MNKRTIQIGLPILIIVGYLAYSWTEILTTDILATWQHHLALVGLGITLYLAVKNWKIGIIGLGIFLILATLNIMSLVPGITSVGIKSFDQTLISVQPAAVGILIVYLVLNTTTLIEMYLDHKEKQSKSRPLKRKFND